MKEYRVEVKPWMTLKSSDGFDFMKNFNNDIPMPLVVMYTSGKLAETRGMVKMTLHGDIKQRIITTCMGCGRPLTNKVSQFFGIGPICGGHNYVSPFDTEEELNEAVAAYREKLVNTVWTGFIAKSAIRSIEDEDGNIVSIEDLPLFEEKKEGTVAVQKSVPTIKASIVKPIKCTDDYSVLLKFDYNAEILASVKAIRTSARWWHADNKVWEIAYSEFNNLKAALSKFNWEVENEDTVPDTIEVDEGYQFKTQPMKHQFEGIQFGLEHSRFLLADDQGLGKTKEIIDLALIRKQAQNFKHCLIICCVNSLKWNWLEEIQKHSDESGYILGQRQMKRSGKTYIGSNADKLADINELGTGSAVDSHYFIITNIESLRNNEIAERLKEICDAGIINMIAADESHRCKNLETKQGQGLVQLQPYYRIAMTGTPLINTPLDLYSILKWLGYEPYEFKQFKYHFCQYDKWGNIVGYKNIDQLRAQLSAIMIRRTKGEVLDLPEKIYKTEYVELTDEQKSLYNQVIKEAVNSDGDEQECILATKLKLRQVSGGIGPYNFIKNNPKLDRLEQIVEEAVYSGTKVLVFSNWIQGIGPAVERLKRFNPVVITGEVDDADRQSIINRFQTDDSVKVFLATTGAAGVGLTLTAATEVVFLDEPWNNGTKEQAIDRCHRIGTKSAVTIHTIMSYGTYDEDVHDIVEGKKALSNRIVETREDLLKLKVA